MSSIGQSREWPIRWPASPEAHQAVQAGCVRAAVIAEPEETSAAPTRTRTSDHLRPKLAIWIKTCPGVRTEIVRLRI